jgi:hypothetical protein
MADEHKNKDRRRVVGARRRWLQWMSAWLLPMAGSAVAAEPGREAAPAAGDAEPRTLVVGPAGQPAAFLEALDTAKDGDTIALLPGEYRGVVGVISQKRLTLRGVGQRPVFVANGKSAEDKAILVVRDGDVRIENLEFRGVRVRDGNGAGVRLERGRLEVHRCVFVDNESGVMTSNEADVELSVTDCVFSNAPRTGTSLPHLLYVGRIAKATITGCRFHRGYEGHLIKSRARVNTIAYNMIRDTNEGEASYEVDLPNGGDALLIGNIIGQSALSRNPVVVSFGAEGRAWPLNRLVLSHNTLISEGWRPGWFVRTFEDRLPGFTGLLAVNNLIVGAGVFRLGVSGTFEGNWPATLGMLADVTTAAFELPPDSWLRGRGVDPRDVNGRDLAPRAEFEWPVGTRPLSTDRARWAPGAYQR